jgi:RimJ/RimL family protein N-acetyltransferase
MIEAPPLVEIRPVRASDADALYPQIAGTAVIDTLVWDGPPSLDEYREALAQREAQVLAGLSHFFTIVVGDAGRAVGSITLRPKGPSNHADIGLWVGASSQGLGYGTAAIGLAARYGFGQLSLERIEAYVFVGNVASRRAFEKNGFALEQTLPSAVVKWGEPRDEWLLALPRARWASRRPPPPVAPGLARPGAICGRPDPTYPRQRRVMRPPSGRLIVSTRTARRPARRKTAAAPIASDPMSRSGILGQP